MTLHERARRETLKRWVCRKLRKAEWNKHRPTTTAIRERVLESSQAKSNSMSAMRERVGETLRKWLGWEPNLIGKQNHFGWRKHRPTTTALRESSNSNCSKHVLTTTMSNQTQMTT
jgi:hypothetical protein